jgi:hypothetical protein
VHASRSHSAVVEASHAEKAKEESRKLAIQITAFPQLCHGPRLFTASALSRTRASLIAHSVNEVSTKQAACSAHVAKHGAVVDDLTILRERLRAQEQM